MRSEDGVHYFNPRSHERSDFFLLLVSHAFLISIHAPTRGATKIKLQANKCFKFQSTLPREERQVVKSSYFLSFHISIHAPTRGATLLMPKLWHKKRISIHAPTRGATYNELYKIKISCISIHAPTRGATHFQCCMTQI